MPEYLAPGVFVEETSFRPNTIEGVSTSTTGFVGPTRFGPTAGEPPLLTSFADFERIYGGIDQLAHAGTLVHNDLAHAARAFFDEGGRRLYVSRTYQEGSTDGRSSWTDGTSPAPFTLRARHPGEAGDFTVTFSFNIGENVLGEEVVDPTTISAAASSSPSVPSYGTLRGAVENDVVLATLTTGSPGLPEPYIVERFFDNTLQVDRLQLRAAGAAPGVRVDLANVSSAYILTVNVVIGPMGQFMDELSWDGLTFASELSNSLPRVFEPDPTRVSTNLFVPLVIETPASTDAAELVEALLSLANLAGTGATVGQALVDEINFLNGVTSTDPNVTDSARRFRASLSGGTDGVAPQPEDYEGDTVSPGDMKTGLLAFEDIEDISIVAAPGSTRDYANQELVGSTIIRLLISHCERMRYRVAVVDAGDGMTPGEVRGMRAAFDSTRAAFYYPWVRILDPVTDREIVLPPSGYLAGIWARNDVDFGVHKSPANEVVRSAAGFEFMINKAQQESLNPNGINVLRFFEGRGNRVWGARTMSSNPEWKYLNVRRYFAFLERSIERGTQWTVFQNNGDLLWARVRRTIEDFLFNEWKENHLFGLKPSDAFFVKCDRSTMSQNDIDNGRLICLIGVAPLRPAEFVIFRIGQKTAEAA